MRRTVALAAVALAAGCVKEPTAVDVVPGYVTWVEWPTAVTTSQPGALRVSGFVPCGYRLSFRVSVDSTGVHLAAEGHGPLNAICPADVVGAVADGPDSLLPLPRLEPPSTGLPAEFAVWAPVMTYGYSYAGERRLGALGLRASADTTTRFAGVVHLYTDSAGCWRARPYSWLRRDEAWVFAKPVPLTHGYYYGYVSGYLGPVVPPVCGEAVAIHAHTIEVNVAPPWPARTRLR